MKTLVEITNNAYNYDVDGKPLFSFQVFENGGAVVIVSKLNGQLSSLALPHIASARALLMTLAEALDHEVIAREDGTIRFYDED
jgi:hypothetical protein